MASGRIALENATRTAIAAVGSIEQYGPHLPLTRDTLAGAELSRRIAAELGDALAIPTIRLDALAITWSFFTPVPPRQQWCW